MNKRPASTVPDRSQKVSHRGAPAEGSPRPAEIVENTDRLLDEIDAALEGQAALAGYRQQPGQ
jgi:hypothetical protein